MEKSLSISVASNLFDTLPTLQKKVGRGNYLNLLKINRFLPTIPTTILKSWQAQYAEIKEDIVISANFSNYSINTSLYRRFFFLKIRTLKLKKNKTLYMGLPRVESWQSWQKYEYRQVISSSYFRQLFFKSWLCWQKLAFAARKLAEKPKSLAGDASSISHNHLVMNNRVGFW